MGNRCLFTGRRYDAETGNTFYRARYYSPSLGRFLSPDPLGFDAGDYNLYRYAFNNPAN
ncbi:MAG: RHS repeat-associated core domain-containing protein, partial [Anaerolineae bacterium]|nr:RHS repeat-associated core domain-containing protein [Anaerolineae bacterium]